MPLNSFESGRTTRLPGAPHARFRPKVIFCGMVFIAGGTGPFRP